MGLTHARGVCTHAGIVNGICAAFLDLDKDYEDCDEDEVLAELQGRGTPRTWCLTTRSWRERTGQMHEKKMLETLLEKERLKVDFAEALGQWEIAAQAASTLSPELTVEARIKQLECYDRLALVYQVRAW